MVGDQDSPVATEVTRHSGVVLRACSQLFDALGELEAQGWHHAVTLEVMEIYNETLRDLLLPGTSTVPTCPRGVSHNKMPP